MDAIRVIGNSISKQPPVPATSAPAPAVSRPEPSAPQPQVRPAEKITRILQESLGITDIKFDYSVHEATGSIVVKVINNESGKVIREIPPKELLALAECIVQELHGLLYDEQI